MKKISILFLFVMVSTVQGANSAPLFTKVFLHSSGASTEEICYFDGIDGTVTVTVTSAGYANSELERVSDCIIYLNGNVLFDAYSFNQVVEKIYKIAHINSGNNVLKVIMKGKPGERLHVSITHKGETFEDLNSDLNASPPPEVIPRAPQGLTIVPVTQVQRD